ncbi:MAG TPA: STAS domain-containing protein [Candidatus Acidoferrales bacterium]|nr:STAS domain-containing protein [Candidatus Acidoferrales bacterium]
MDSVRIICKSRQIAPGVTVVEITGRLLMGADCALIDKQIEALIAQEQKRVILDLSEVRMIDSAGVGQVVKSFTRLKKSGGDLRVAGVSGMLDGVFKLTQVHKVIGMYANVQEASQGF